MTGGLFGFAKLGGEPLRDEEWATVADGATPSIRTETAALTAASWAQVVKREPVTVVGAAHLVGATDAGSPLESIAAAYRARGIEGFGQIEGQFCIALVDSAAGRTVLATDRFATRVLYHAEASAGVVFGSSLSCVAAQTDGCIDPQAILEYLLYTSIPSPRTAFAGVYKLPPAHCLVIDRSGVRLEPYWDMGYAEERGGTRQWARRLRREIEETVRRHVAAEEDPESIGAFLSGGTDSSTVSGMIGRIRGVPAKTFSIGYAEEQYDELVYARTASKWFGTVYHERRVAPEEALALLPEVVRYYEEPFGNASALPTCVCARFARENGVRVLYAGDGGDELFAGNERYGFDNVLALYQRLPAAVRRVATPLFAALPDSPALLARARSYVRRSNIPNPRRFFSYRLLLSEPAVGFLTGDFLSAVEVDRVLEPAIRHFHHLPPGTSELNRLLYLDLKLAVADNDVRKVSGMADLAGVEVRYPFLDSRLAEFSGRIPAGLKLRGFQKRYIFKRALADFLPPEVLRKQKHGFGAPVPIWMKTVPCWRELVGDVLADRCTRERGYFRSSFLDGLQQRHAADGTTFYGEETWTVLMLELWHREHGGRSRARRDAGRSDPSGGVPARSPVRATGLVG